MRNLRLDVGAVRKGEKKKKNKKKWGRSRILFHLFIFCFIIIFFFLFFFYYHYFRTPIDSPLCSYRREIIILYKDLAKIRSIVKFKNVSKKKNRKKRERRRSNPIKNHINDLVSQNDVIKCDAFEVS